MIFALAVIICVFLPAPGHAETQSLRAIYAAIRSSAIASSPEIRSAQAQFDQRRAQVYTSFTRWLPRLDLQLSQSRTIDYSIITSGSLGAELPPGFLPTEVALARWNLSLTTPLYRRSVHIGVQQAFAERDLAENQLELKRSEIDSRLRSLLGNYFLQAYQIAIQKSAIEAASTNFREASLRFKLGERTRVDVIRAEANLATLESRSATFEQELDGGRNSLLEYAGMTKGEFEKSGIDEHLQNEESIRRTIDEFAGLDSLLHGMDPYLNRENVSEQIVRSSPAYRTYVAEREAADARARSLMAQEWPELNFQATLSKQAQTWNDALSGDNQSRSLALVLTLPLFSSGSTISTFYEKKNAEEANLVKSEADILRLRDESENQVVQIHAQRKTLQSQTLILSQNEELVRLSRKSYQLGKTTLLELLTSENDLRESKLALARTKINLAVILRKFAWNLGLTVEFDASASR